MTTPVRVSIQLEGPVETAIDGWAINHLEERGYSIRPPNEKWETPSELCGRLHVHTETLRRNLEHEDRPNVIIRHGPSGRVLEVLTNADFDEFVIRNKKRGKIDRRDHAARMRKRRAGRTNHVYKGRAPSSADAPRQQVGQATITTAKNWKSSPAADELLRGKEISDRVHRKLNAK